MTNIQIFKRLYKDYTKYYIGKIFLAVIFSILVAGSTSATAYLLDPAIDKIFLNKDQSLLILIPFLIIIAFATKGISLYMAKFLMINVAEEVKKKIQMNMLSSFIKADTEYISAVAEFEKVTRVSAPKNLEANYEVSFSMPKNLNYALKLSSKNNPSLAIARINLAISEKELNVEKAKLSPSATLNYSKSENKDLSATIDEDDQETVKATISWPIVQGGKNFSSIKKFKHKKEKNRLLLEDTENEVKTQTANLWSFFQSAESVLNSTAAQLKAAEIANEGITLEYDSGNTRTTLDVIQSRSLLLEARISHAKAGKDLIVSKLQLLSQVGGLNFKAFQNP